MDADHAWGPEPLNPIMGIRHHGGESMLFWDNREVLDRLNAGEGIVKIMKDLDKREIQTHLEIYEDRKNALEMPF